MPVQDSPRSTVAVAEDDDAALSIWRILRHHLAVTVPAMEDFGATVSSDVITRVWESSEQG